MRNKCREGATLHMALQDGGLGTGQERVRALLAVTPQLVLRQFASYNRRHRVRFWSLGHL